METNQPNDATEAPKAELEELEAPELALTQEEADLVEGGAAKFVGGASLDGSTQITSIQYPYKL